ncbi:MAG: hypothetical protein ACRDYV_11650, partial [Acidimicrobiia bacterium]
MAPQNLHGFCPILHCCAAVLQAGRVRRPDGRSGSEVEFDTVVVAGWPNTGVATDVGGVVLAKRLGLRKFGEGVEFPIEPSEPAGGFGVVGEPGRTLFTGRLELISLFLEVLDGLVKTVDLGPERCDVAGLSGGFLVGPTGGLLAPMAAVSPT